MSETPVKTVTSASDAVGAGLIPARTGWIPTTRSCGRPPWGGPCIPVLAGTLSAAVGALVLAGWLLDVGMLKSLLPGLVTMKANTAFCFVLAGLALAVKAGGVSSARFPRLAKRVGGLAPLGASLVALVGLMTLLEYIFSWDPGLDQLLFTEAPGAAETSHPGRMAVPTALNFLLLGAALLMPKGRSGRLAARTLTVAAAVIAALAFFGYLFDLPALATFGPFTAIAVTTALTFLVLCAGLLAGDTGSGPVALATRHALPLGFAAAVLLLLLSAAAVLHSTRHLARGVGWVAHTEEVKGQLAELLSRVQDVENGARGFILSRDRAFLESYHPAAREAVQILGELRALTRDNPQQQGRLEAIAPLLAEKIAFNRDLRALGEQGEFERAAARVRAGDGKRLMDRIRLGIGEIREEENALLQRRKDAVKLSTAKVTLSLLVALLAAFGLLGAVFGSMSRELAARRRVQDVLQIRNLVFEASLAANSVADTRGVLTAANRTFLSLWGYASAEEVLGRPIPDFLQSPAEARAIVDALDRTGLWEGEYRALRKNGSMFLAHGLATVIRDANGALAGYQSVVLDVTAQHEAQEALRAAKGAAEAANRAKSEFLANVSHELRTPLNGILGLAEMLLDAEPSERQRRLLATLRESARSMTATVNALLDFARLDAGALAIEPRPFALRRALEDPLESLGLRARGKGLGLTWEIAAGVPERLIGDPGRLQQVLVNLVENAIKFTERGGIAVRVENDTSSPPSSAEEGRGEGENEAVLHFLVRDTGIGIPPEQRRMIFEAFAQADGSSTRQRGGIGLGLTISASLVALMGGRIWLESAAGAGSTFHFTARFRVPAAPHSEPLPIDGGDGVRDDNLRGSASCKS